METGVHVSPSLCCHVGGCADIVQGKRTELASEESRAELRRFHDLVRARYGPFGKCALFPSPGGEGGVVCLTRRSEKLYQMLTLKDPVLKLILGACQAHVSTYKDCGLYTALLAIKLVMSGLKIEKPRFKVAMVTSHTLSLVTEWLTSGSCSCKLPLSLSSTRELLTLTRTYITSKTFPFNLSTDHTEQLCSLILQAFLRVLPKTTVKFYSFAAHVHVLGQSGLSPSESVLLGGVAIATSDAQLLVQDWGSVKRDNEGVILTAVFNVSLAGDFDSALPSDLSILTDQSLDVSVEGLMLERLLTLVDGLVTRGVGVVGCQKCVHPLVKQRLKEKGVLVIERLSAVYIESVREVTGGQLNSRTDPGSLHIGRLRNISVASIGKERYLVLEGVDHVIYPHCTLVVCSTNDTAADEMVPLVRNAISLLEQSLSYPHSFLGGGCTDTVIAHMLINKAKSSPSTEVLQELECNQATYSTIVNSIAKCFSQMAAALEHNGGQVLTDSTLNHCWSFPPYDYCFPLTSQGGSGEFETGVLSRKCCCGLLSLRNMPSGTKLTDAVSMDSISVPDSIHCVMENLTLHQTSSQKGTGNARLLDFGLSKIKAIETAGDIGATVLQIAYSVSEL